MIILTLLCLQLGITCIFKMTYIKKIRINRWMEYIFTYTNHRPCTPQFPPNKLHCDLLCRIRFI